MSASGAKRTGRVVQMVRLVGGKVDIVVSGCLSNFIIFCLRHSSPDEVSQPVWSTQNMVVVLPAFIALVCLYLKETITLGNTMISKDNAEHYI